MLAEIAKSTLSTLKFKSIDAELDWVIKSTIFVPLALAVAIESKLLIPLSTTAAAFKSLKLTPSKTSKVILPGRSPVRFKLLKNLSLPRWYYFDSVTILYYKQNER